MKKIKKCKICKRLKNNEVYEIPGSWIDLGIKKFMEKQMTKEQAIERLKSKLDNDKEYLEQCNPFSDLVNEVRLDNKSIEIVLSMLEEKDKIIDLMADDIHGTQVECNRYFKDKEDVKQYFKNKAKELLNK